MAGGEKEGGKAGREVEGGKVGRGKAGRGKGRVCKGEGIEKSMSRNGVWQLKRLTLHYCSFSGSSAGVRQFVEQMMPGFREKNKQLELVENVRRGRHPFFEGQYGGCRKTE